MIKHYVEYFYPGLFGKSVIEEIPHRDVAIHMDDRCVGYQLFDREEIRVGDEVLRGEPKNYSGLILSDRYMLSLA